MSDEKQEVQKEEPSEVGSKEKELTDEQKLNLLNDQEQLMERNGVFRREHMRLLSDQNKILQERNDILSELGQKLLTRLDNITAALNTPTA